MPRIVRGALLQATWTGDKESMIQKHEAARPRGGQAGRPGHALPGAVLRALLLPGAGARVLRLHRAHPRRARRRSGCRTSPSRPAWSSSCRCTRRTRQPAGIYYNTAAVIDADGEYLGKYRKTHIPHVKGFWEKYYFRPGNLGYPVFETAVGKVGVYICYDRHFPEGARALGLNGAEMVFIPSRHVARPVRVPVAHRAGQPRGRQRLLRGHDQPGRHRAARRRRLLRPELLRATRAASSSATSATPHNEELLVRDMDLDKITEVRQTWQFYRDRRPDAYGDLVAPVERYRIRAGSPPGGGSSMSSRARCRGAAEPPDGSTRWSSASRSSPSTRSSAPSR